VFQIEWDNEICIIYLIGVVATMKKFATYK